MLLAALLALQAVFTPPPACTVANSEPVAIPAIQMAPERYLGRCVAVTGLLRGNAIFTSLDAYYLAGFVIPGNPAELPILRQRLILHGGRLRRSWPRDDRHVATIFGRIANCDEVRRAARVRERPGEWVMVTGFCHYMPYAYLETDAIRLGPVQPLFRLMGEADRVRLGDLTPVPDNWPHRAFVEGYAARYLEALRRRDRRAFLALHLDEDRPGHGRAPVRLAFGRHPGFAALRQSRGSPPLAIFLWDGPGPRQTRPAPQSDDYGATLCFCRTADCVGRWPISRIDADNAPSRPYVCTDFGPYVLGVQGIVPAFSTEQSADGFPEPRANHSPR